MIDLLVEKSSEKMLRQSIGNVGGFFSTKHFLDLTNLDQHFFFNEKYLEEKNVTYSDPKFSNIPKITTLLKKTV